MDKDPFSFVFEHHKYPYARTLRTSVTQKIKDSLSIFTGNIVIDTPSSSGIQWFFQATHWELVSEKIRLGVFDYLTFCIPYGVTWCLAKLLVAIQTQKIKYQDESDNQDTQNMSSFLLRTAVYYAEYPVWLSFVIWNVLTHGLLRISVSLLGVFFLGLPISLLTAYGSYLCGYTIKQDAFTLQGVQSCDNGSAITTLSSDEASHQDREHQQHSLERISLEDFLLNQKGAHVQSLFDAEQYTSSVIKSNNIHYLVIEYPSIRLKFYAAINHENLPAIDALAKLNFAHVVDALQKMCEDDEHQCVASQSWATKSHFFQALHPAKNTTQTETTFVNCLRSVYPWL